MKLTPFLLAISLLAGCTPVSSQMQKAGQSVSATAETVRHKKAGTEDARSAWHRFLNWLGQPFRHRAANEDPPPTAPRHASTAQPVFDTYSSPQVGGGVH